MTSFELGVRNAHSMVYDGNRANVILFGGADASKVCGDTWEWNGDKWLQKDVGKDQARIDNGH